MLQCLLDLRACPPALGRLGIEPRQLLGEAVEGVLQPDGPLPGGHREVSEGVLEGFETAAFVERRRSGFCSQPRDPVVESVQRDAGVTVELLQPGGDPLEDVLKLLVKKLQGDEARGRSRQPCLIPTHLPERVIQRAADADRIGLLLAAA